jgi:3-phosphoshikimate 1-carboxyvinyltransferase
VSYPEKLAIVPLRKPPAATIQVPGSKSITNRALVLAALTAKGYACALHGALRSEDTEIMIEALRALGFRVLTEWPEGRVYVSSNEDEPLIPARGAELFAGNSGTTMRFLTALVSLGHGRFRLDGVPRMRERPIEDLLAALRQLGVNAYSEQHNGCPPVIVEADGLNGGTVRIQGHVSSQFLSSLLLAAPFARDDVTAALEGPLVSWPYVYMTAQMLRQWGLRITHPPDDPLTGATLELALLRADRREWGQRVARQRSGFGFCIPGRQWSGLQEHQREAEAAALEQGLDPRHHVWLRDYAVEPDASAASYFFGAAAICGGRVTIPGLHRQSLQGDVRFAEVLAAMGCDILRVGESLTLKGGPLEGVDVDLHDISDTVMTLAAVACFAEGPTTIRQVGHIRHKETDRLKALATELRRVGAGVDEYPDGLTIHPGPLHGAEIETYHDHRMAMGMALIGLQVPGIVIKNPGCVAKTYPEFFTDLEKLRNTN